MLRERIASFEAPASVAEPLRVGEHALATPAISAFPLNDLRKNLRDLNETMDRECASSMVRDGWCSMPR